MSDVWHNPALSDTKRKGGARACSPLTNNVLIRDICSLSVSELPLCSSDPYDTSSGSLQLISIKPMMAQTNYSCAASFERSQDSTAIVNGEVTHTAHPVARHVQYVHTDMYSMYSTFSCQGYSSYCVLSSLLMWDNNCCLCTFSNIYCLDWLGVGFFFACVVRITKSTKTWWSRLFYTVVAF